MIRKFIAIIVAVLINCAVLACFHAWRPDGVANATPVQPVHALRVLPTMTVRPTRSQLEYLHRADRHAERITATAGAHAARDTGSENVHNG